MPGTNPYGATDPNTGKLLIYDVPQGGEDAFMEDAKRKGIRVERVYPYEIESKDGAEPQKLWVTESKAPQVAALARQRGDKARLVPETPALDEGIHPLQALKDMAQGLFAGAPEQPAPQVSPAPEAPPSPEPVDPEAIARSIGKLNQAAVDPVEAARVDEERNKAGLSEWLNTRKLEQATGGKIKVDPLAAIALGEAKADRARMLDTNAAASEANLPIKGERSDEGRPALRAADEKPSRSQQFMEYLNAEREKQASNWEWIRNLSNLPINRAMATVWNDSFGIPESIHSSINARDALQKVSNAIDVMTDEQLKDYARYIAKQEALTREPMVPEPKNAGDTLASLAGILPIYMAGTPKGEAARIGGEWLTEKLGGIMGRDLAKSPDIRDKLARAVAHGVGGALASEAITPPHATPDDTAATLAVRKLQEAAGAVEGFVPFALGGTLAAEVLPAAFYQRIRMTPDQFKEQFPGMVERAREGTASRAEQALVQDVVRYWVGRSQPMKTPDGAVLIPRPTAEAIRRTAEGDLGMEASVDARRPWLDDFPWLRDMLPEGSRVGIRSKGELPPGKTVSGEIPPEGSPEPAPAAFPPAQTALPAARTYEALPEHPKGPAGQRPDRTLAIPGESGEFTNPNDPALLDYLARALPRGIVVRMSGADRLYYANNPQELQALSATELAAGPRQPQGTAFVPRRNEVVTPSSTPASLTPGQAPRVAAQGGTPFSVGQEVRLKDARVGVVDAIKTTGKKTWHTIRFPNGQKTIVPTYAIESAVQPAAPAAAPAPAPAPAGRQANAVKIYMPADPTKRAYGTYRWRNIHDPDVQVQFADRAQLEAKLGQRDRSRAASDAAAEERLRKFEPAWFLDSMTADRGGPQADAASGKIVAGYGRLRTLRDLWGLPETDARLAGYREQASKLGDSVGIGPMPAGQGWYLERALHKYEGFDQGRMAGASDASEYGRLSNENVAQSFSDAELAMMDAERILQPGVMEHLQVADPDNLLAPSNAGFIEKFMANRSDSAALVDSEGRPAASLEKRLIRGMVAALIGADAKSVDVITALTERAQEWGLAGMMQGLTAAAPRLIRLHQAKPGWSLVGELSRTMPEIIRAKEAVRQGKFNKPEEYFLQADFTRTASAEDLAIATILLNAKSGKQIATMLDEFCKIAEKQDVGSGDMFASSVPLATKLGVLERLVKGEDWNTIALGIQDAARAAGPGAPDQGGGRNEGLGNPPGAPAGAPGGDAGGSRPAGQDAPGTRPPVQGGSKPGARDYGGLDSIKRDAQDIDRLLGGGGSVMEPRPAYGQADLFPIPEGPSAIEQELKRIAEARGVQAASFGDFDALANIALRRTAARIHEDLAAGRIDAGEAAGRWQEARRRVDAERARIDRREAEHGQQQAEQRQGKLFDIRTGPAMLLEEPGEYREVSLPEIDAFLEASKVQRKDAERARREARTGLRVSRGEGTPYFSGFGTGRGNLVDEAGPGRLPGLKEREAAEAARRAWLNPTPENFQRAFDLNGGTVSAVIPQLMRQNIPAIDVRKLRVRNSADAAGLLWMIKTPIVESMKALYVSKTGKVLEARVLSIGLLDASLVHPRDVFRDLPEGTDHIYLGHNHPSGSTTPSADDIKITRQIKEGGRLLGIKIADHLVTNGGYLSMRSSGLAGEFDEVPELESVPGQAFPRIEEQSSTSTDLVESWETIPRRARRKVSDPSHAMQLLQYIGKADQGAHIFGLDSRNGVVVILRVPRDADLAREIGRASGIHGVAAWVAEMPQDYFAGDLTAENYRRLQVMQDKARILGIPLLDVIITPGAVGREQGQAPVSARLRGIGDWPVEGAARQAVAEGEGYYGKSAFKPLRPGATWQDGEPLETVLSRLGFTITKTDSNGDRHVLIDGRGMMRGRAADIWKWLREGAPVNPRVAELFQWPADKVREDSPVYGAPGKRDSEYMAAVERGDMATAQRLVDEAFDKAHFPTKWGGFSIKSLRAAEKKAELFKVRRRKWLGTAEGQEFVRLSREYNERRKAVDFFDYKDKQIATLRARLSELTRKATGEDPAQASFEETPFDSEISWGEHRNREAIEDIIRFREQAKVAKNAVKHGIILHPSIWYASDAAEEVLTQAKPEDLDVVDFGGGTHTIVDAGTHAEGMGIGFVQATIQEGPVYGVEMETSEGPVLVALKKNVKIGTVIRQGGSAVASGSNVNGIMEQAQRGELQSLSRELPLGNVVVIYIGDGDTTIRTSKHLYPQIPNISLNELLAPVQRDEKGIIPLFKRFGESSGSIVREDSPAYNAPGGALSTGNQNMDLSDAGVAARMASFRSAFGPDGVPEADKDLAKWAIVERGYKLAQWAEKTLPGVPLKDVFLATVTRGHYDDTETLDAFLVPRGHHRELMDYVSQRYKPGGGTATSFMPGLEPMQPRTPGYPSYEAWKNGARFDLDKVRDYYTKRENDKAARLQKELEETDLFARAEALERMKRGAVRESGPAYGAPEDLITKVARVVLAQNGGQAPDAATVRSVLQARGWLGKLENRIDEIAGRAQDIARKGDLDYAYNVEKGKLGPEGEAGRQSIDGGPESGAPGSGSPLAGTTGGAGPRRRTDIRIAGARNIPQPANHVPAELDADEDQRLGINLALDRFAKGGRGFLLADGTGMGKTTQILLIDSLFRKENPGATVLIVTQNAATIKGSFFSDAKRLGISLDDKALALTTYDGLKSGKALRRLRMEKGRVKSDSVPIDPDGAYDLVIMDEAHNLKNLDAEKTSIAGRYISRARHVVFATATPMDRPSGSVYFMSQVTGLTPARIGELLGFEWRRAKDSEGVERNQIVPKEGMDFARILANLANMRDEAVRQGAMIRREYPMKARFEFVTLDVAPADLDYDRRIVQFWQAVAEKYPPRSQARKNAKGQATHASHHFSETLKIGKAVELAQASLAAGRKPIIVVQKVDPSTRMHAPPEIIEDSNGRPKRNPKYQLWQDIVGETRTFPAVAKGITEALRAQGLQVAEIYGGGAKDVEIGRFQGGKADVAVMTAASGGTGVNLDDIVGDKPRDMIICTPIFAGDMFQQVLGRISRRNTASVGRVIFVNAPQIFGDAKAKAIQTAKVKMLTSIQQGADIDLATFNHETGVQISDDAVEGEGGEEGEGGGIAEAPLADGAAPEADGFAELEALERGNGLGEDVPGNHGGIWEPRPAERAPEPTTGRAVMTMPAAVRIYRLLTGQVPDVKRRLRILGGRALGVFYPGTGLIGLKASIFDPVPDWRKAEILKAAKEKALQEDGDVAAVYKEMMREEYAKPENQEARQALATIMHEIGHLYDWLPDKSMAKGNILGRIGALREYMLTALGATPADQAAVFTPEEREEIRAEAEKEARRQIPPVGRTGTPEAREARDKAVQERTAEIYAAMIERAAGERGLVTRDQIMGELKALTQWWKPFDEKADERFTRYRYSPEELMADAISVMMNRPEALHARAPLFERSLFAWMGQRPTFQKAWDQIQAELIGGDSDARLIEDILEGFREGEKLERDRLNNARQGWSDFMAAVRFGVIDTADPILRKVKEVGEAELAAWDNPRYAIEDAIYVGGVHEAFLKDVNREILEPLRAAGLDTEKLGLYMLAKRAMSERRDKANPYGMDPAAAARIMKRFEEAGQLQDLARLQEAFFDLYRRTVLEPIRAQNIWSPDEMERILANDAYATFAVLEHLNDKYGAGIGLRLFRQVGTLKAIKNPFVETIQKGLSLVSAAARNQARKSVVAFLSKHFPGEIEAAATRWNGKGRVPVEPTDPDQELLVYMEGGKIHGWYVNKWIAKHFTHEDPVENLMLARAMGALNKPFRMLFVEANPEFWLSNTIRDIGAAVLHLPGATVIGKRGFLKHWLKSVAPAYRGLFSDWDETTQEALKARMLISSANRGLGAYTSDEELDRLLHSAEIMPESHKANRTLLQRLSDGLEWWTKWGKVSERSTQLAIASWLRDNEAAAAGIMTGGRRSSLDVREKAHLVRSAASPAFLRKGAWSRYYTGPLMFANAIKEGWRSEYEAYKRSPGLWWLKMVKYYILPRLAIMALRAGLVGGAGWLWWDHRKEKREDGAGALAMAYRLIPEYDLANYLCIPLGINEDGKAVYLRLPQTEQARFTAGLLWKMGGALGATGPQNQAAPLTALSGYAGGEVPNAAPWITLGAAWANYAMGINPVDLYRGQNWVADDTVWEAGGAPALKAMLVKSADESGFSPIVALLRQGETPEAAVEKVLKVPGLRRFVKVSDRGAADSIQAARAGVRRDQARERLTARAAGESLGTDRQLTPEEERALVRHLDYVKNRIRKKDGAAADRLTRELIDAQSPAERAAVLRAYDELTR